MSDWPTLPLTDVLDFKEGPGILAKDFHESGVPLIRLAGIKYGARILNGCNYLDPSMVEKRWSSFRLSKGDVLLSTSASLGEVAVVGDDGIGAVPYTGIIRFRPRDDQMSARFIPIALTSVLFKRQIEAMGAGSVLRHFGPMHLRQMTLQVPPRPIQDAIADIVESLNDKIGSNRLLVQLIPQLIRAKVLAALADEHDEVAVAALARFVNGGAYTKAATGTGRMVIRIADLNSGPGGSTVYNDIDVPDDKTARPGDILMSWSGSLDVYRWALEEAIVNQHIFKVLPTGYPAWLVFDRLDAVIHVFQSVAKDKATTMGHIQRGHLDTTQVDVPAIAECARLDKALSPLWDRLLVAEQETIKLSRLRDTLLPDLLSGRIGVPETAESVETAA